MHQVGYILVHMHQVVYLLSMYATLNKISCILYLLFIYLFEFLCWRLVQMHQDVCEKKDMCDEMLYGRAGYLFSLLFVRQHIGNDCIDIAVIKKVKYQVLIYWWVRDDDLPPLSCGRYCNHKSLYTFEQYSLVLKCKESQSRGDKIQSD